MKLCLTLKTMFDSVGDGRLLLNYLLFILFSV